MSRHFLVSVLALASVGATIACGSNGASSTATSTTGSGASTTTSGDGGSTSAGNGAGGDTSSGNMNAVTSGSGGAGGEASVTAAGPTTSGAGGATATTSGGGGSGPFSFFVTSVGSGAKGGNFGGLAGADAFCKALATKVGEGNHTWRAYLSATGVNARDRIGKGPWFNVNGDMVASDVTVLHNTPTDSSLLLDENGKTVPQVEHDIVTGSTSDGKLNALYTCYDWTTSDGDIYVAVGHVDWSGQQNPNDTWNSTHETPCSQAGMKTTGCAGRIYCFATD